ncbi:tetratricopeptide repeat protein, partial [Candidatus Aerophobetes bacterium]|nr:tetratricopeptide repeat protein [Candidatus Aerophobetes bacterium]
MKVLRIGILTLAVLFLIVGTCYAQSAEEYYTKGIDYGVAGKFEEAQQEFKKALETDPFYTPARMCLKLSEDTLKQRIKTGTALHLFKGVAYYDKDMYDEAIAEYKKAIKINPNYAEAHCVLGAAYGCKEMCDEAIAECKKAIEINPNLAEAHGNLGAVYAYKGMFDEAIAEYKKAIKINPNYAEAHCVLGLVYAYKGGMFDEAIA